MADATVQYQSVILDTLKSKSSLATDSSGKIIEGSGVTPTVITVANEATDTTCFPAFFVDSTGDLAPKTNSSLTLNSSTGLFSATSFAGFGIVPIGSILSWAKSLTGTPALPSGYVECNGQTLSDAASVYNGKTLPSLNSTNKFLRGNTTSGGTGGASTHTHTLTEMPHTHDVTAIISSSTDVESNSAQADINYDGSTAYFATASHSHGLSFTLSATTEGTSAGGTTDSSSNVPSYYDVVYIIRIK